MTSPSIPKTQRRVVLANRPAGEPSGQDFRIEEAPVPEPGPGQVLVRAIYLSLDPYMRGRMRDVVSYAPVVQIGEVMPGGIVGEVVKSNNPAYKVGDIVEHAVLAGFEAAEGFAGALFAGLGALMHHLLVELAPLLDENLVLLLDHDFLTAQIALMPDRPANKNDHANKHQYHCHNTHLELSCNPA